MRLAVVQPRAACGCTDLAITLHKHLRCGDRNQLVTVSHSHFFGSRNRSPDCAVVLSDMLHDLNIPWTNATSELQRTVVFLDECECDARVSRARAVADAVQ
jgi:hypothetical protein